MSTTTMYELRPRAPEPQLASAHRPSAMPVRAFAFDGGAGSFVGTAILAFLVTVLTLGICYPWAVVMFYRWKTNHTIVNGHRLRFTGSAWGLFGNWIKWWLLIIITIGIYSFWVYPRLTRWIVEHQEFDPRYAPR
jgi:uncharacterized membrane protein YjgN (DUF898 family)